MRILVTGHLGFIGHHVFNALSEDGHEVVGLDWPDDARLTPVPVVDAVVNMAAIGGAGRAARAPYSVMQNNVGATMAVAAACLAMPVQPRVVHASSFSVYGDAPVPTNEDAPLAPKEIYGASKLAQELCWTGYPGPITILRFSSVYGRGMRLDDPEATIIAKIAGWVGRGEPVVLNEDGQQTRDWVHVDDVVDSITASLLGLTHNGQRDIINVCSGQPVTLDRCARMLGATPTFTGIGRPGDMRHCLGDPSRMVDLLRRPPTPFDPACIRPPARKAG